MDQVDLAYQKPVILVLLSQSTAADVDSTAGLKKWCIGPTSEFSMLC